MTSPVNVQCWSCKHYRGSSTCDAYPEQIPTAIIYGEVDHTKPYEGDNGIQFEAASDEDSKYKPT